LSISLCDIWRNKHCAPAAYIPYRHFTTPPKPADALHLRPHGRRISVDIKTSDLFEQQAEQKKSNRNPIVYSEGSTTAKPIR
jgi:hypothetical protein